MPEPSRVPTVSTFVIRFWREWSATAGRWRGRVEHVPSGDGATFVALQEMLGFFKAFGIMPEDEVWSRVSEKGE